MAGFEGFGFTSPEEIESELQASFQRNLQSGDPAAMRAAMAQQAAVSLVGTPELRKARKTQEVLKNAQAASKQTAERTGLDEVDAQMEFYRQAQSAAIDAGLPEIAIQATENLSKLRVGQEQRNRLKAQEDRAEAEEQRKVTSFAIDEATARTGMVIDTKTNRVLGQVDLAGENPSDRVKELRGDNPDAILITMDQFLDRDKEQRDRLANMKALGNRTKAIEGREFVKQSISSANFAITAQDFTELLIDPVGMSTFGIGGQGVSAIQNLGSHAESIMRALNPDEYVAAGQLFERYGQSGSGAANPNLRATWNQLNDERKALVMDMAYALATSREGGRLTDQDIDRAVMTLGIGNSDPRSVAWVFSQVLIREKDKWNKRLIFSHLEDDPAAVKAHGELMELLDQPLNTIMDHYGLTEDQLRDRKFFNKIINDGAAPPTEIPAGVTVTVIEQ